jgi:hypothetical protein
LFHAISYAKSVLRTVRKGQEDMKDHGFEWLILA